MKELQKAYNPKEVEEKIYKFWEGKGLFSAKASPKKKPYCIVIPPPNITGILHMGHALNNTIQDVLIRWKRMQGYESMWMPGTDHAGIATQNVVEKELASQGINRHNLGREEFLKRVWKWREEYGSTIINQLKKLGSSCDWDRERFTMDEGLSNAVLEVFIRLYKKGLIYRGNYIINWCPRCQTALSDEEAEHKDIDGMLYYIKYPFKKEGGHLLLATTRPETMLGDVAVCVNPGDKRYKKYIGKTVILPVINREIPVIADEQVDIKFGTGVLKITPAHDPVDFALGLKHKLEPVNVMNPDATMNEKAGEYVGMDRLECRETLVHHLKEKKLFVKSEVHRHAVGHCYRCNTMVEPRLSEQWFVKMKPLAKPAIDVVKKGKIKFVPARWTKVYLNWMENIRDWCISRQIWWGHRIPVYYCKKCKGKDGIIVSKTKPGKCPKCGSTDIEQDPDVLDTWFSSWLWPFSTFGWPEENKDFKYFYPTNTLVTAQEIIFFWVARMIMAGLEFTGNIPFSNVYIHGTVRDDTGTKMSKSLGNIIDPLDIINSFGADALRFSIILITSTGQDVFLSPKKFEIGRNFANKIWNASRFILTTLKEDINPVRDIKDTTSENKISNGVNVDLCVYAKDRNLKIVDKWILSRFYSALKDVNKNLDQFRLNEAASRLYEFFWHELCDWYIEFSKLSSDDRTTQIILYKVLEKTLRLLHPFMPFITEELWQNLPHKRDPIMVNTWPHMQKQFISAKLEEDMRDVIEVVTAIRNIRSEWNIDQKQEIEVTLSYRQKKHEAILKELEPYIEKLCRLKTLEMGSKVAKPPHSAYSVCAVADIHVHLEGVIDFEREKARLAKKKSDIAKQLEYIERKLKDKNFLSKAPKEVIEKNKLSKAEFESTMKRLEENLKDITL